MSALESGNHLRVAGISRAVTSAWTYRELLRELIAKELERCGVRHSRAFDHRLGHDLFIPGTPRPPDRGLVIPSDGLIVATPEIVREVVTEWGVFGARTSSGVVSPIEVDSPRRGFIAVPSAIGASVGDASDGDATVLEQGARPADAAPLRVELEPATPDAPAASDIDAAIADATEIQAESPAAQPETPIAAQATTTGNTRDEAAAAASPITPLEALRHQELASTGRVVTALLAMAAVALVTLPVLGRDRLATWLLLAGVVISAAAALWLQRLLKTPARYAGVRAAACWGLCTAAPLAIVYHAGPFSPAPALLCLGVYITALGQSRAAAWVVLGICVIFQGGLGALILGGVVTEVGFMTSPPAIRDAALVQAIVHACLLGAFVLGRSSRRAKLLALSELERAKRDVVERQGLIEEAREDLDRALRFGESGRFTERRVGSYRLGALIGRGSMGDVYEAAHVETGSLAAIKLIQPELLERAENRTRFARELAIAASLKVRNVVRVLEMSEPDAELPYLAMERLFGHTLNHHIRGGRRLAPADAVKLAREVGRGIDAAARAGIIHRDLKPQNLFLHEPPHRPPSWKILDFGVSKLAESGDTLTHGRIIGTPAYMAPEQAQSKEVDSRADVYALGAILYRALTGRKPFSEGDVAKTLFAVVYTMPPRPSELAELPAEVDVVLAVALAKPREARFQTGLELAEALEQALAGKLAPSTEARARALARHIPWGATARDQSGPHRRSLEPSGAA